MDIAVISRKCRLNLLSILRALPLPLSTLALSILVELFVLDLGLMFPFLLSSPRSLLIEPLILRSKLASPILTFPTSSSSTGDISFLQFPRCPPGLTLIQH